MTTALERAGGDAQALQECFYLRALSAQQLGEHRAAIADFTRAIELAPDRAGAYLRRSWSYHEISERAVAESDFQVGRRILDQGHDRGNSAEI